MSERSLYEEDEATCLEYLRLYEEYLAQSGRTGPDVVVVAPTQPSSEEVN